MFTCRASQPRIPARITPPLLCLIAASLCSPLLSGCAPAAAKASTGPSPAAMKPPAGSAKTIVLWPNGAPLETGDSDSDVPKLYLFPAAGPGVHSAVIVMPGGGYVHLAMEREGGDEARWLSAHGVTAFVLGYRLGPRYHFPAPMLDAARAVRYVRSHAAELGVARDKIGLWGFSAGAHLSGYLATKHDAGEQDARDPIDRVSDRPDFAVLSYGRFSLDQAIPRKTDMEGLLGKHPTQAMLQSVSVVKFVTADTPPCFLYATTADQIVNSLNATAFYDALKQAGVPAELHIFERGPHGTGMAQNLKKYPELAIYPALVENWMQMHGWMAPEATRPIPPNLGSSR